MTRRDKDRERLLNLAARAVGCSRRTLGATRYVMEAANDEAPGVRAVAAQGVALLSVSTDPRDALTAERHVRAARDKAGES